MPHAQPMETTGIALIIVMDPESRGGKTYEFIRWRIISLDTSRKIHIGIWNVSEVHCIPIFRLGKRE